MRERAIGIVLSGTGSRWRASGLRARQGAGRRHPRAGARATPNTTACRVARSRPARSTSCCRSIDMPQKLLDCGRTRSASSCRGADEPACAAAARTEPARRRPKRRCATSWPCCARAPATTSATTSARPCCAASSGACRSTRCPTLPAYRGYLRRRPRRDRRRCSKDMLISVTQLLPRPRGLRGARARASCPTLFAASTKAERPGARVGAPAAPPARRPIRWRCCCAEQAARTRARRRVPGLRHRHRRARDRAWRARASTRTSIVGRRAAGRACASSSRASTGRYRVAQGSARAGAVRRAQPAARSAVLAARPDLAAATC